MTISTKAIDVATLHLKADEGLRLKPYRCTSGKLTIGYGRNLDDVGIYMSEAENMLDIDVGKAAEELECSFPWVAELTDARQAVLVNMVFNLGINRFCGFRKMLAAAEDGDFTAAADEMLDSRWAKQVGNRAQRLAAEMREG